MSGGRRDVLECASEAGDHLVIKCRCKLLLTVMLTQCCGTALAQGAVPPQREPRLLEAVVVNGNIKGPGFWQVYKDDRHDLWIMGTLTPRPADIQWDATEARRLVSDADQVLWPAIYGVDIESNIFQQAALGWGYLQAQKNPDGKKLREVLSPELYARWQKAKAIYLPRNSSVERQRPLTAAQELLDAVVKRARMTREPLVVPAINDILKANKTPTLQPMFTVHLTNAQAKAALTDVRRQNLDDARCLEATLDAIDQDVPHMVGNANAWANGELEKLSFAGLAKREAACSDAMMNPEFSAKHGLPNILASVSGEWLKAVERALASKQVTVAFMPMENLVGPNNLLDQLRARGYTVNGP